MKRHIFYGEDCAYIRINKTKAKISYDNGEDVTLTPVNFYPQHFFGLSVTVNKSDWGNESIDFYKLVDNYEMFNCRDNETGRYAAYYHKIPNYFAQKRTPV